MLDQSCPAEHLQVLADGGPSDRKAIGDLTDRGGAVTQQLENPPPDRLAEGVEDEFTLVGAHSNGHPRETGTLEQPIWTSFSSWEHRHTLPAWLCDRKSSTSTPSPLRTPSRGCRCRGCPNGTSAHSSRTACPSPSCVRRSHRRSRATTKIPRHVRRAAAATAA